MKNQVLGIFFYMLYLLAMIRPIVPVLEYYANYDYIAAVLCENRDKPYLECNGKCYLKKQLKKVNDTSHSEHSNLPKINFDDYPVSPVNWFKYLVKTIDLPLTSHTAGVLKLNAQDFIDDKFNPPRFTSLYREFDVRSYFK